MKKFLLILAVMGMFTAMAVSAQPTDNIRVIANGQEVAFTDQQPVIIGDRTLVPVRDVFEAMGFDVDWNEQASTVFLDRGNMSISIRIGEPTFSVAIVGPDMPIGHASIHPLDVPAQLIGGRTMLPLRALLEAVGYQLNWNEPTRTITITTASGHGHLPPALPIVNIRHFLRANMNDFGDLLGNQTNRNPESLWVDYYFDTGLVIGADGQTIMSIWVDYRHVNNRFHFDWLHGGTTFGEVEAHMGNPYFIEMRGDAPPPAEGVFDPAFITGFHLSDEIREFVRFYFNDNNEIIGIRLFG